MESEGAIDLYWIPLGAGAQIVKASGMVYEWFAAKIQRRHRCALYHSALVVTQLQFCCGMGLVPLRGRHVKDCPSCRRAGTGLGSRHARCRARQQPAWSPAVQLCITCPAAVGDGVPVLSGHVEVGAGEVADAGREANLTQR